MQGGYCTNYVKSLFYTLFLFCQHFLDLKSGHATTSSARDRLSVLLVLHITGGVHPPHARLCRSGDSQDVSININLELIAHDGSGRFVTDSVEETGDGKVFLFTVQHVLDAEVVQEVAVTLTFECDGMPEDSLKQKKPV